MSIKKRDRSIKSEHVLSNILIDVENPEVLSRTLSSKELAAVSRSFAKNIDDILALLSLPLFLLTFGASELKRLELFAKALVSTGSVSKWEKDSKTRKKVEAEVNRLVREEVNGGDITTDADIILGQLLNLTEIHSAVRALLLSATSASWTAFECVAKDSWTAALNVRPRKLGQKTIQEIGSDILNDGLSARSISVGLLAKHGFDLRNSLGTLLNEKFDFTSLKGMRKAFISAFEEREKIEEIFGGKVLKIFKLTEILLFTKAA